jgi:ATP synthase protein I
MSEDEQLRSRLDEAMRRASQPRRRSPLGLLVTGGTVGLLFVVPIVAGAYLGRWLDERATGYSVHWTVNLILLGLAVGAFNVYRFFKEHG